MFFLCFFSKVSQHPVKRNHFCFMGFTTDIRLKSMKHLQIRGSIAKTCARRMTFVEITDTMPPQGYAHETLRTMGQISYDHWQNVKNCVSQSQDVEVFYLEPISRDVILVIRMPALQPLGVRPVHFHWNSVGKVRLFLGTTAFYFNITCYCLKSEENGRRKKLKKKN